MQNFWDVIQTVTMWENILVKKYMLKCLAVKCHIFTEKCVTDIYTRVHVIKQMIRGF